MNEGGGFVKVFLVSVVGKRGFIGFDGYYFLWVIERDGVVVVRG